MATFTPKLGQTDFTNVRWAPVINCVLKYGDKILLVKRSAKLNFYPGYWNGVSGFLDDQRSLEEKVRDEINEELGITRDQITSITAGQIFHVEAPELKKTWIVHPILVAVKTDQVKLDWEAQEYQWISLAEARKLKLVPGFDRVLDILFS